MMSKLKNNPVIVSRDFIPNINLDRTSDILPKFYDILNRDVSDIGIDEIDQLQHELETLLCTCLYRESVLSKEIDLLDKSKDFNRNLIELIKSTKQFEPCVVSTRSISPSLSLSTPVNILPTPSSIIKHQLSPLSKLNPNVASTSRINDYLSSNSSTACKTVVEGPNINNELLLKFWSYVDGYCGSFKSEHIGHLIHLLYQFKRTSDNPAFRAELDGFILKNNIQNNNYPNLEKNEELKPENSENQKVLSNCKDDKIQSNSLIDLLFTSKEANNDKLNQLPFNKYQELIHNRKKHEENKTYLNVQNPICLEVNLRNKLLERGVLKINDLPEDELLNDLIQTENDIERIENYLFDKTSRMFFLSQRELVFDKIKTSRRNLDSEIVELYKKYFFAKSNDNEDWPIEKRLLEKRVLEILHEYKGLKKISDELQSSVSKKPKS